MSTDFVTEKKSCASAVNEPGLVGNSTDMVAKIVNDEGLLNLTSALKSFHRQKTRAVLPIFWHWMRINYDTANATPEWHEEVQEGYLKMYRAAKPLKRVKAVDVLEIYSKHFFKTATADERAALASALGMTPIEYEIRTEGFSMRELMQALKIFNNVPDDLLTACFERYAREWYGRKVSTTRMAEIIATYRLEPPMRPIERAKAILKNFGIRILNDDNPDDLRIWKKVSSAREH